MRPLLAELLAALDAGPCAWCSVIGTRGSTPQKPGAAMIVFADGGQSGTLGGGCVEAEVKRRALAVLLAGSPRPGVQTFFLDDISGWDDGLICGGQMTILIQPLFPGDNRPGDYYRRMHHLLENGFGFTEAVALEDNGSLAAGDRYLFDASGALVAWIAKRPAVETLAEQKPPLGRRAVTRQGVAWLPTPARITLLLVGGGHVSKAVAPLAAAADFQVAVLDDRAAYANAQRFPDAARLIVGEIGPSLTELAPTLTPATYAIVMTRGHHHDEEALGHLVVSGCSYVGMIGSRRKVRLIFDDLIARGARPEALARVHAPVGLDIGAQSVPEIAVSIVAELIRFRNLGPDSEPRREAISLNTSENKGAP
jgi:xanthine dehydrogenase accessory factor